MKTILNLCIFIRLFKSSLGILCSFAVSALAINDRALAGTQVGVFQIIKGEVEVHRSGEVQPASVGMQVFSQDKIVTKPDARARVQMRDRNILNISPNSSITLEKYVAGGSAEIKVDSGKLRSSVQKNSYDGKNRSFSVKTPTAVAGVRGTDFLTSFDPNTQQSQVVTFSGAVAVAALDPSGSDARNPAGQGPGGSVVIVGPSQATTVVPGAPPSQPVTIDTRDLNSLENESKADSVSSARSSERTAQAQASSNVPPEPSETNESSAGSPIVGAPRTPSSSAASVPASAKAATPTPTRMIQSTDLSTNLGGSANLPTPPSVSMPINLTLISSPIGVGGSPSVPTISPEINQIINETTGVNRSPNSNTTINLITPETINVVTPPHSN
jgi:hypothetical protein